MTSQLQQTIARFRAQVLAGDARALSLLARVYAPIRERLVAEIEALLTEAAAQGLTPSEIDRFERATTLLSQVETEISRLASGVNGLIVGGQRAAVQLAGQQATGLVAAQSARIAGSWNRVPTAAVRDLVGRLSDGSPLADWLGKLGPQTSTAIADALTQGLATGQHPAAIAQELAGKVDLSMSRLLMTTRTAILGSYRSATLANYRANDDILDGWVWIATLDDTTCAACLALHGEHFGLDVEFQPCHPSCRCSSVPSLKGIAPPDIGNGAGYFDGLDDAAQDRILGKAGGSAYRDGSVALSDFVQLRQDDRWGDSYSQGSLASALANAASGQREAA